MVERRGWVVVAENSTKTKRERSLKRRLLYAAIPTVVAFLVVESLFRLYFLVEQDASVRRMYENLSRDPAYKSKSWFSREFVAALSSVPPQEDRGDFYTPPGYSLVLLKDYQDRFHTIRDGFRTTVGFRPMSLPLGRRPRVLFMMGGSTTFCAEVPDEGTCASELQQRLAAIPETSDIKVVNCGTPAAVSLQEVERLEYEISRNNIPDFCVFFDGINDACLGVHGADPGGTCFGAYQKHTDTLLFRALKQIGRSSVAARSIYRSILRSQRSNAPAHTRSASKVRELANATAKVYEQNMLRAKEICDRHHIQMFVFLQPHVFSIRGRPLSSHERAAAERINQSLAVALQACYPLLREKLIALKQRGIMTYDISDAFDRNLEPIFVDCLFHVETTGNGLIADAILKRALPELKKSPPFPSRAIAMPGQRERRAQR
jgi:hypothetical protein